MSKLVCIGEAMAELRFAGAAPAFGFGGDTFNTAVYAARLLPGAVTHLTRVGHDPLSDRLIAYAEREGLPAQGFLRDPEREIGIYAVNTDARGERSFHYWRERSAARHLFSDPADFEALTRAEIAYLSGITLAILPQEARDALRARLAAFKKAGGRVAFDSNFRPRLWDSVETARTEIAALWALTDIALPSLDDEMALFGGDAAMLAQRLHEAGCALGAIKRGAEGPLALSGCEAGPFAPAQTVLDTTAAGDSFNAAYLAALISGEGEAKCLAEGHALAARVVGQPGAIIAQHQPDSPGV